MHKVPFVSQRTYAFSRVTCGVAATMMPLRFHLRRKRVPSYRELRTALGVGVLPSRSGRRSSVLGVEPDDVTRYFRQHAIAYRATGRNTRTMWTILERRLRRAPAMVGMGRNLRRWGRDGHWVVVIDVSAITAVYETDDRGQPPYHPAMMTKVLVYGYCIGVFSSRKIARRLIEDVAFRVLAAGNTPDFRTIADFRKIHLTALEALFTQVLRVAREAGALHVGRVAVDGSKVKANASKHKAMSYGRMQERETSLAQEVHHLLTQAEATDAHEDAAHGTASRGDDVPAELRRRETRLARIRAAKRVLEARAKAQAADQKPTEQAKPEDKAQYNFTDPESRIMKGPDGFVQAYNAQIVVDAVDQLIVGQAVTQEANDKRQLQPMIETVVSQAGEQPAQVLADSGYCSEDTLTYAAAQQIDAYIATERQKHTDPVWRCPRGPLPKTATVTDRMRRKLQTKRGKDIYRWRKAIVEPVFGQIKHGRGFRQFLLRGVKKVQAEWALVCLGHNVLKLHGLLWT